jgi:hypothetical protein
VFRCALFAESDDDLKTVVAEACTEELIPESLSVEAEGKLLAG